MSFFGFTKTIIKSLFKKPATLMYPIIQREFVKNSRGHIEIKMADCIYCGMCQRKCPTGALVVNRNEKTWEIDRLRCISCNYCVEVCPKKCLTMENTYSAAAFNNKEKELHKGY